MIGLLGGGIGLAATPAAAFAVNDAVARLTGIESLIAMRPAFLGVGLIAAVAMGVAGAVVAGYLITRLSPLENLE